VHSSDTFDQQLPPVHAYKEMPGCLGYATRSVPGPAQPCPPSLFPPISIPSSSSQPQTMPFSFQPLSQISVGPRHFSPTAAPQRRAAAWWSLTPHPCSTGSCACPRHQCSLGHFSTPRKPLLPDPASRDVYTTLVMSCAEELGASLHDGAGEATALLEQREARFGHVRCGGLLSPGSHFLLFDRSYGKRNSCLPGDKGTGPSLLLRAPFPVKMLTLLTGCSCIQEAHHHVYLVGVHRQDTGTGTLGWKCLPPHWGSVHPTMMEAQGRGWPAVRGHKERRTGWIPQLVTSGNDVMKCKKLVGKGQMKYIKHKRTPTRPHSHWTWWLGNARREA